jgi:hypothetical protein
MTGAVDRERERGELRVARVTWSKADDRAIATVVQRIQPLYYSLD